jgi:uncharacterized protein
MADRFVKNPADIVKVHQKVDVTVLEVDLTRSRISLSMKSRAGKLGSGVENPDIQKAPNRGPKSKPQNQKKMNNRDKSLKSPLAEALIKSGLK